MSQALDAKLRQMDPKDAKARRRNSPGGRRDTNIIKAAPEYSLLRELLARAREDRRRKQSAERMLAYRERLANQRG